MDIVLRYLGDQDPTLIAEDAVLRDHGTRTNATGADAIGAFLYDRCAVAFPDASGHLRNTASAPPFIMFEFDFVGRNSGPIAGRRPTGRAVAIPVCAVCRVEDGVITSVDLYWNSATLDMQLS